ncbi:NUDIX hydrolase [Phreatobacter stygius]|uniref:NUDIX hydrolase n=1 Tax=Phreatobacter stygius TaxID=1940610 RepID=A0A4D7B708_9HYPH|nr:NUDIX hydrolase [Phreatobacter stygius]QCI66815.1 NUDIX hydrolase [Phreatobacter stygius]
MSEPPQADKGHVPDKPRIRRQYGVLPFRLAPDLEILLLTSRETKRWVVPKGWPMKGRKPRQSAAREALEEAGIVGKAGNKALGSYSYMKLLKNGQLVPCKVKVFALQVRRQLETWREQEQRETRWFAPEEAAEAVQEPELAAIIRAFAAAKG